MALNTNTGAWASALSTRVNNTKACAYNLSVNGTDVFYVNGQGWLWCSQGGYFGSDSTTKKDIAPLDGSLKKILALNGVQYKYKDLVTNTKKKSRIASDTSATINSEEEIIQSDQTENTTSLFEADRNRIGLLAQEVEEVIPDLVRTMPNGTKAIAYTDLIAVLVEAMKEQQDQISDLKESVEESKSNKKSAIGLVGRSVLYQNKPNPFSESSEISFHIPSEAASAYLNIYDLQGSQLESIQITARGNASHVINASTLSVGMYLYTLIVDGQEVDTKRMIITE